MPVESVTALNFHGDVIINTVGVVPVSEIHSDVGHFFFLDNLLSHGCKTRKGVTDLFLK